MLKPNHYRLLGSAKLRCPTIFYKKLPADLKAVLVNEFYDINIDSQIIGVPVDENSSTNGCICCTINDGLLMHIVC